MFYIRFDDVLIYSSYSSTEVSDSPERLLLSPVELFEMGFESFFSEDLMRASSFEKLNYIWYWMNQRNTEIYMNMVIFHTNSNRGDVEFFTDSFEYLLYFFLKWFCKTFSSIFGYPYYVIPTVIYCM